MADPAATDKARAPLAVDNALTVNRPQLGNTAPVALYRLVRLVAFEEILGRGASATGYIAGKRMGKALGLPDIDALLKLCSDLSIGIVKVPFASDTEIQVDVYECVSCAGMTPVGRALCSFEGGLIAGVVEGIAKAPVTAKEKTCIGGLGDECCGFEVSIRK